MDNIHKHKHIKHIFKGGIIHSLSLTELEVLHNGLLGVSHEGEILFVCENEGDMLGLMKEYDVSESDYKHLLVDLLPTQFLLPGFIDTHIHAPQYRFTGTGTDLPLLKWLEKYTFPHESKCKDPEFARDLYHKVVRRTLKNGTTTALYYSTLHYDASLILAQICTKHGQRAFVGKCNMDSHSPDYYIESTEDSIRDTKKIVQSIENLHNPKVQPIITPRFAGSCTLKLMEEVAKIANEGEKKLLIQTHIAENTDEVKWIRSLFPQFSTYAHIYDQCGLLTDRTVMAHAIYLSNEEMDLFKQRNTAISHCPTSNFTLNSGVLCVRKILEKGIKLGLGTDVSGGPSPSILHAIRDAIIASSVKSFEDPQNKPLLFHEAFYLATLGGANTINMEGKLGNFQKGKYFDALLIDTNAESSPFDVFEGDQLNDIFQKFIFLGDDRNIVSVWVQGEKVIPFAAS